MRCTTHRGVPPAHCDVTKGSENKPAPMWRAFSMLVPTPPTLPGFPASVAARTRQREIIPTREARMVGSARRLSETEREQLQARCAQLRLELRHNVGVIGKPPANAFKPGCAPGPGRPKGMRNRLTEIALQALGEDFAEHGAAAIKTVRETKPHAYLSIVASLLPRQVSIEKLSPFADLTDDELDQLERYLSASRANAVQEIDGKVVEPQQQKP